MRKLLAAGLLAIGSVTSSYGFVVEPDTGSTLVISNATYYGNEGDINRKFKGYIGGQDGAQLIALGADPRIAFTNIVVTTNTFGIITNNTWSPGVDSNYTYYVDVNFSGATWPETLSTVAGFFAYWRIGIMPNDESSTNYLRGDGGYFTSSQGQYGSVSHHVKIGGNEKMDFEIATAGTNFYVGFVRVDLNVVGEYE